MTLAYAETPEQIAIELAMSGRAYVYAGFLASHSLDDDELIDGLVAAREHGLEIRGFVDAETWKAVTKRQIARGNARRGVKTG